MPRKKKKTEVKQEPYYHTSNIMDVYYTKETGMQCHLSTDSIDVVKNTLEQINVPARICRMVDGKSVTQDKESFLKDCLNSGPDNRV